MIAQDLAPAAAQKLVELVPVTPLAPTAPPPLPPLPPLTEGISAYRNPNVYRRATPCSTPYHALTVLLLCADCNVAGIAQ